MQDLAVDNGLASISRGKTRCKVIKNYPCMFEEDFKLRQTVSELVY